MIIQVKGAEKEQHLFVHEQKIQSRAELLHLMAELNRARTILWPGKDKPIKAKKKL